MLLPGGSIACTPVKRSWHITAPDAISSVWSSERKAEMRFDWVQRPVGLHCEQNACLTLLGTSSAESVTGGHTVAGEGRTAIL